MTEGKWGPVFVIITLLLAIIGFFLTRDYNRLDAIDRRLHEVERVLSVHDERLKQQRYAPPDRRK